MTIQNIIQKYGINGIFTIAEVGNNHMGDINIAKDMIDAALHSGASAVKFQKRCNAGLFQSDYANLPYIGRNSFGDTYLDHREKIELSIEQMFDLKKYATEKNILFFSRVLFEYPKSNKFCVFSRAFSSSLAL